MNTIRCAVDLSADQIGKTGKVRAAQFLVRL